MGYSYTPQPLDRPVNHLRAEELADILEAEFDQELPFRADVVWELARRALVAEGSVVSAGTWAK